MIDESKLPLELPEVSKFLPTETGEPPLGNATQWAWDEVNQTVVGVERIDHITIFPLELNTMPGFAGSSAYYLRYMDPRNHSCLVDPQVNGYWQNVDYTWAERNMPPVTSSTLVSGISSCSTWA